MHRAASNANAGPKPATKSTKNSGTVTQAHGVHTFFPLPSDVASRAVSPPLRGPKSYTCTVPLPILICAAHISLTSGSALSRS